MEELTEYEIYLILLNIIRDKEQCKKQWSDLAKKIFDSASNDSN